MILIVDGSREMGASLERVLKYRGYEAMAVQDGMESLALLNVRKPKMIILELQVSGMDGMALLQAIRQDSKFTKVPVIVYTEVFADDARRAALANGAEEFIVKGTIGWESLVGRIQKHLPVAREPLL